ncbi:MAG: hypothetical protein VYB54_15925 [Pseudomonadota bacterium]|nr:hypothetical protein [Pseudomonadota bacterium]
MRIEFRCLPGYAAHLPGPAPATTALPDWLRTMPAEAASAVLGGAMVRTLKQCPPFIDAMRAGVLFPLATDLSVDGGELAWDWDLPRHPVGRQTRAPVGVHVPEQASGAPFALPDSQFVVKFTNFWTIGLPEGWSMLFVHPLNRLDLPFRTLAGVVDCDRWRDGFVHFPAVWTDPDFTGTLPAGTPVAQGIPFPRNVLELDIAEMDEAGLARHAALQDALQAEPGLYRRDYRGE